MARNFVSILIFFVFVSATAYAGVDLSVTPIDGSNSLRFERLDNNNKHVRQVRLRVSSTGNERYQVFQRIYGPITNEKGQSLDLQAIETETMASSNTSGTLYLQSPDRLSYSQQLLYTSGQEGTGDSFMIAYSPKPEVIKEAGRFSGKIIYVVRALGDASQREIALDLFLDSAPHGKINIEGGKNPKSIRIADSTTAINSADFVKFEFEGDSFSGGINIFQEFELYPQNDSGAEIDSDAFRINVEGENSGLRIHGESGITKNRVLIYSGKQPQDDFLIYFLTDPDHIVKSGAGVYKGKLKYTVESDKPLQEFIIDFECRVQPIFMLDVQLPPEGLSFGRVLAASPAQEREITVEVRTNLRKPYQVMQNMPSLMTNESGKEFNQQYFTFKVSVPEGQKGSSRFSSQKEVEKGEYPIFFSDNAGSPAKFTVTYQLKGYFEMKTGNFLAPLTYSLNQN